MPQDEDSQTESRRRHPLLRRLFDVALIGVVALAALWAAFFYIFAPELPDTDALLEARDSPGLIVIGADGTRIAQRGALGGVPIRLAKLPPHLSQAVIATEDRRFYQHFGIDLLGFSRALLANIRAGEVVQGGSTITQQLAKNLYLSAEQTILRKIKEAYLAIWLETRLSKDEILELYLNRVYLGAGTYGVEAAAQRYFGKTARAVDLAEAAMLAGLLKAPTRYAPTNDLQRAQARADQVLQNMVEAGYLTAPQAEAARRSPAQLSQRPGGGSSDYFVDWLLDGLQDRLATEERDLILYTTLDPALQAAASDAIRRLLARDSARRQAGQAALVALDRDGAVRALVGGRSYARSQFNRASHAHRQPGSAFKPFVYLAALENGFTPSSVVEDAPLKIDDWQPRNHNGRYRGAVRLRDAFAASINTVAVRLQERVGRDRVIETARRLGIESRLAPHPSLALGSFEVTPLELTAAYIPFANGGRRVTPYGLTAVRDQAGRWLYRHRRAVSEPLIPRGALTEMNDLLAAVVQEGTGRAARPARGWAAGKTGTTQDSRDGWFVGYTADLVLGVWVGNDDNSPMRGVSGGGLPAEIWKAVADWSLSVPLASRTTPLPRRKPEEPEPGSLTDRLVAWVFDQLEGEGGPVGGQDRDRWEDAAKGVVDWLLEEIGRSRDGETAPPQQRDR